ncbi:4-hydroxy-tetrahydrodipicolinate synthase [Anaerosolibacter carboniphilus]|uniref:4-hydroxy-tetrahydrodipicolinate synthase n=1 Tax=Anaerosolibacter carboniphilus TaxID=1417629 RepID=A0A841KYL9_9FIRM|nr:4-hydroxy-tetrahydrodipicolinate synthase [Anaerosolibacter carboniphilus]MBB6217060.1 4-hydroxy-tetrahydrodipicolinate synthase [Anaerosolibacter carboniphilus]
MKSWGRLITAMVTPFNEKLEVNYEQAVELANRLVAEGTTALVVSGTTGEGPTLTAEEKENLFCKIKENISVPVIAGIGTNSTASTIENAKRALACGVDGLLIVAPYYNKPDQDSLFEHFRVVAEAVEIPIMLYNVPGRTGCNIGPETIERLSKIENIVALKEASGNIIQLSEAVKRTPDDFLVYTGEDVLTLPSLSVGAYGVVSVASHVVGSRMKEMINSFLRGNTERATEIHFQLLDIFNGLFVVTNPIPVKAALNMMGIRVGDLRMPLTAAKPSIKAEIQRHMRKLDLV